jgi:hypothetical protein
VSARRSTLEHDSDRRVYRALQVAAEHHAADEGALAEYIGMALRQRWTWVLIGEALHMSPRRASAIWQRDLKRRGIE